MAIQMQLLGRFALRAAAGEEIAMAAKKGQALIAYLALSAGEPVARERLTALLWSDRAEAQARSSLRQALTALRRAFDSTEPPPLRIDADEVALDPAAVEVDAVRFLALSNSTRAEELAEAVALYRGDLLAGLQVRDAAFDDWLADERRRLQRLFEEVLARLLALQQSAGEDRAALATAERLVARDPLNEPAQRSLMRLYVRTGERTRALAQYKLCRDALTRELGVEPEAETKRLRDEIKAGTSETAETDIRSPEKPAIAVLPFANQSGIPEQDFVGVGLAEDLAMELGRFRQILVIDHESSANFRKRETPSAEIGRALGAQYLLSGSIRRSDREALVTTRLVEADSGRQIWAERYEVAAGDLFALQQEVAGRIVATVAGRIEDARRIRARQLSGDQLAAYDYVVRARQFRDSEVEAEVLEARSLLQRALTLDPDSSVAHGELALTYIFEQQSDWTEDPATAGHQALDLANKAVTLDKLDGCARFALACAHFYVGEDFERARQQFDKALELNPNDYEAYCLKSWLVACEGQREEAMACATAGLRLNPLAPAGCLNSLGVAAYLAHRYEDAIQDLGQITDFHFSVLAVLAACHALLGQEDKAQAARDEGHRQAREVMADYPGNDGEKWRAYWARLFPFRHAEDSRHLLDGLAKAGWTVAPERPTVPTIAVLPFANLSGDPAEDYFAEGITQDIITELARYGTPRVMARHSAFELSEAERDPAVAGEKLGVRYLVQGSLRKAGKRVRISVQLIEAANGAHLWAEHYDRELDDIFAIQDEVVHAIVATLGGRVTAADTERALNARPETLAAYDTQLRALYYFDRYGRDDIEEGYRLAEAALAQEPSSAQAVILVGWFSAARSWWQPDNPAHLERALEHASKAVALDPTFSYSWSFLGNIHLYRLDHDLAEQCAKQACTLNPHYYRNKAGYAEVLAFLGRFGEAEAMLDEALQFEPLPPDWCREIRGVILYGLRRYAEAAEVLGRMQQYPPWIQAYLAACHAQLGEIVRARAHARAYEAEAADGSIEGFRTGASYFKQQEDLDHWFEGLRKAGLRETSAPPQATSAPTVDRPSVAVLPFANLSGDPEQEYFADGITEDILSALARFRTLFVIARTSAFSYKGRDVDPADVGRELGVRYLVEGSVRQAGKRVRVGVQLVEAETGSHLWAEHYDRDLEDIFAVQDEITRTVASTLSGRLDAAAQRRASRLTADGLAAYDLALRAKALYLRFNRDDNAEARALLQQAIGLDPGNAQVYAHLALLHLLDWLGFWVSDREATIAAAYDCAKRAVELDDGSSQARWVFGEILMFRRDYEESRYQFETAIRMNPNDTDALCVYGLFLAAVGEAEEGHAQFEEAARLDPFDVDWRPWLDGSVLFTARRYEEAIANLKKVREPMNDLRGWLAACYAQAGHLDEARGCLEAFLTQAEKEMVGFPGRHLEDWKPYLRATMPYRDEADFDHLFEALRKAGLQAEPPSES